MLKRWRRIRWILVIVAVLSLWFIRYFDLSFSLLYVLVIFFALFAFSTFKIYTSAQDDDN